MVILFDSSVVFFTFNSDTIFQVLFNPVVPYDSIWPQPILGDNMDSIFLVFPDHIHENIGVATDRVNTSGALSDFAKLNLSMRSSLDFNSRALNMRNIASKDLRLGVHSLDIDSNKGAWENMRVLNHNSVVSFRNDMQSSLLEIWKSAIRNLQITVYSDSTCGMICFISDKVTTDHVDWTSWESYESCELLVEPVRNWLQSKDTFSQDKTSRVDRENTIHVSWNIELLERFHASFRSIFYVLLSLFELFR